MNRRIFVPLILVLSICLFCCTSEQSENEKVLSKINDYELTIKEFEEQLVKDLELNKDFKLTRQARKKFLDQLIRKELLIQEAKKLKLDRKEKFIKAIQRYWESTLIRDLMELRGEEISERTYVSKEEIEIRYKEMKGSEDDPLPFKEVQERIAKKLKKQKKHEKLKEWVNELRKNAKIEINEELLYSKQ